MDLPEAQNQDEKALQVREPKKQDCKRCCYSLDCFARKLPEGLPRKESSYRTICGVLFTLLLVGLMAIYLYYSAYELYREFAFDAIVTQEYKAGVISSGTTKDLKFSTLTIDDYFDPNTPEFSHFAVGIVGKDSDSQVENPIDIQEIDPTFGSFKFFYRKREINTQKVTTEDLSHRECTHSDFGYPDPEATDEDADEDERRLAEEPSKFWVSEKYHISQTILRYIESLKCFDEPLTLKGNGDQLDYQQLVMQFVPCNSDARSDCRTNEDKVQLMSGKQFLLVSNARVLTGFAFDDFRVEDGVLSPFVTEDTARVHWATFNTKVPTKHIYRTYTSETVELFSAPEVPTIEEKKSLVQEVRFSHADTLEGDEYGFLTQEFIIERDLGVKRYYAQHQDHAVPITSEVTMNVDSNYKIAGFEDRYEFVRDNIYNFNVETIADFKYTMQVVADIGGILIVFYIILYALVYICCCKCFRSYVHEEKKAAPYINGHANCPFAQYDENGMPMNPSMSVPVLSGSGAIGRQATMNQQQSYEMSKLGRQQTIGSPYHPGYAVNKRVDPSVDNSQYETSKDKLIIKPQMSNSSLKKQKTRKNAQGISEAESDSISEDGHVVHDPKDIDFTTKNHNIDGRLSVSNFDYQAVRIEEIQRVSRQGSGKGLKDLLQGRNSLNDAPSTKGYQFGFDLSYKGKYAVDEEQKAEGEDGQQ